MTEIRLISAEDLAEVAEIERLCFSVPWTEKSLEILLSGDNFGVVAVKDGQIAAYVGVISAPPEADITKVATHPDFRRRGLGEAVISALKAEAAERGIETLFLEVRRSNEPARRLYEKLGFEVIGERRGYYTAPREDAVLMSGRIIIE